MFVVYSQNEIQNINQTLIVHLEKERCISIIQLFIYEYNNDMYTYTRVISHSNMIYIH